MNKLGNRTRLVTPTGAVLSAAFDDYRNLLTLVDPGGNATRYGYDSKGNLTTVTYPAGSAAGFEHDGQGRTVKSVNRRGQAIVYTLDGNGLITRKEYPDGSGVDFAYDGQRRLATATDAKGVVTFTYDAGDRLTRVDSPGGRFLAFTYDGAGRRTAMTTQDGFTVGYGYDGLGRPSGLIDGSGQILVSYAYDAMGRLSRKDQGNGTYASYEYDAAGHLTRLVNYAPGGEVLSRFDYTFDNRGLITRMTTLEGDWEYQYDAAGQMTEVTTPGGQSIQYTYDPAGNRIRVVDQGIGTEYRANALNEYLSAGAVRYGYDLDGNLTSKETPSGTWTYSYDAENRLVGIAGLSSSWIFEYDPFGNRVAAVADGVRREYLNDLGALIGEYDGSGGVIAHYAHGLGLAARVEAGTAPSYYHFDGSANTAQVSGPGGAVLNAYSYLPFGERFSESETVENPFTFVGQYGVMDDGAGFYRMGRRYYDPAQGRFIQPDPIGLASREVNLYRYAGNLPNLRIDPSGLLYSSLSSFAMNTAVMAAGTDPNDPNQIGQLTSYIQSNPIFANVQHLTNPDNPVSQLPYHFAQQGQYGAAYASIAATVVSMVTGMSSYTQSFQHFLSVYSQHSDILNPYMSSTGLNPQALNNPAVQQALTEMSAEFNQYLNEQCHNPPPPPDGPCPACPVTTVKQVAGVLLKTVSAGACPVCPPLPPGGGGSTQIVGSYDPNVKITAGYGAEGFIRGDGAIVYTIYFENQASATAPAQTVVVTDQLNDKLDWSTVELLGVGFNKVDLTLPPGRQQVELTTLVTTDPNPVHVAAGLDPVTGVITWVIESIDTVTGSLPEDPYAGFLPPNESGCGGCGEGYVSFLIYPKKGLNAGETIENKASIVFDVNAAIETNEVTNTIDDVAPTSSVVALPAVMKAGGFTVGWTGSDNIGGSGMAFFDIYASVDGGPFELWQEGTEQTSAVYAGEYGHGYGFYSVATDHLGNRQATPSTAQASTGIAAVDVMVLLLDEGFDSGIPEDWMVAGDWIPGPVASGCGSESINLPFASPWTVIDGTGTCGAKNGDTLYSPVFDTGPVTELALTFSNQYRQGTSGSGTVRVSGDGGEVWTVAEAMTADDGYPVPVEKTIDVSTLAGASEAQVAIEYTGSGGSWAVDNVRVTGRPAALRFSSPVGVTSAAQRILVVNNGTSALTNLQMVVTGANSGDFSIQNHCPASLGSEQSCVVDVTFTPQASGERKAVLQVQSSDPVVPAWEVALTGNNESLWVSPGEGTLGTAVVIRGPAFGVKKGKTTVGGTALKVGGWEAQRITGVMSKVSGVGSQTVVVTPKDKGVQPVTMSDAFEVKGPEMVWLDKIHGVAGDQVTVVGKFFGTKKGKVYLGAKSCKVVTWTMDPTTGNSEVVFTVPKGLAKGAQDLKVTNTVGTVTRSGGFTID